MNNIINIFLIAIALSMDTFSLSMGLGTYNTPKRKTIILSIMVGSMHFIMPFLGDLIGEKIVSFFSLNAHVFLGCILLFIAFDLLVKMIKKESNTTYSLSFFGMFFFSFGVSIDAFSTGLGLSAITANKYLALSVFSVVSFTLTYLGLYLGKIAFEKLGDKANVIGFLLLFILGIVHICQ